MLLNSQNYNLVGVMSGTSLDGIDLVQVLISRNNTWSFEVLHAQTVPYTTWWKKRLAQAMYLDKNTLSRLDIAYTKYLAQVINRFISHHKISDVLAVCSHGHTVYHDPAQGKTLQIGNLPELAVLLQQRVVCDFRSADVRMGGQGAPLVPVGDALLFTRYSHCLNLGGFANISSTINGKRVAFDLCPVNVVMNHLAGLLGREYDAGGAFAKAGTINTTALKHLHALDYYKQPAPKSLGMEWVNDNVWEILNQMESPQDRLATFVEHVAVQIARETKEAQEVLVTGGGAYNTFLLERLRSQSSTQYVVPEPAIVEFKEAVIFAFLGVLRLRNEPNCLASVTGAPVDHCAGEIYVP